MKTFETADFKYEPSIHVPFRDKKVLEMAREITREDFENYPNPNLDVKVMSSGDIGWDFITDIFFIEQHQIEHICIS